MASATVFVSPYAILHESWHHADIFFFFFANAWLSRQHSSQHQYISPSLAVCACVQNKRQEERGSGKENKKSQQIKIAAGSLLSPPVREDFC